MMSSVGRNNGRAAIYIVLACGVLAAWIWFTGDDSTPIVQPRQLAHMPPMQKTSSQRVFEPTQVASQGKNLDPLKIRLSGVIGGVNGLPLALVSLNGAREVIVHVGEPLTDSALVVAIDGDSMTYRQGNVDVRTYMQSTNNSDTVAIATAVPKTETASPPTSDGMVRLPGFMPNVAPVQQFGEAKAGDGNSVFKRDIEKKMASMRGSP